MSALPPVPVEWQSAMPADTLARLIAGVRSKTEPYVTEETLERRRECEGCDTDEFEVYP